MKGPPEPYTWVRLICDDGIKSRFEVRVSTFVEFDDDKGSRAISMKPTRDQALLIAKNIAKLKRDQYEPK